MIAPGKYVPEIKEKPHGPVLMTGPKMPGIEADNKFNVVPPRVESFAARMELPGPVYPGVLSDNKYCKVEEKVHGELCIHCHCILESPQRIVTTLKRKNNLDNLLWPVLNLTVWMTNANILLISRKLTLLPC